MNVLSKKKASSQPKQFRISTRISIMTAVIADDAFYLSHLLPMCFLVLAAVWMIHARISSADGQVLNCDIQERNRRMFVNDACWVTGNLSVSAHNCNDSVRPFKTLFASPHLDFILECKVLAFFLPMALWHNLEGSRMFKMTSFTGHLYWLTSMMNHFEWQGWNRHQWYAPWFVLCEVFSLANILAQVFVADLCLDGNFFTLGIDYFSKGSIFILEETFPRSIFCELNILEFNMEYRGTCQVTVSEAAEKLYLALWVMYASLLVVAVGRLSCRACAFVFPSFRKSFTLGLENIGFDLDFQLDLVKQNVPQDWFEQLISVLKMIKANPDLNEVELEGGALVRYGFVHSKKKAWRVRQDHPLPLPVHVPVPPVLMLQLVSGRRGG